MTGKSSDCTGCGVGLGYTHKPGCPRLAALLPPTPNAALTKEADGLPIAHITTDDMVLGEPLRCISTGTEFTFIGRDRMAGYLIDREKGTFTQAAYRLATPSPAAQGPSQGGEIRVVPRKPNDRDVSEILYNINRKRSHSELTENDVREVMDNYFYNVGQPDPQPAAQDGTAKGLEVVGYEVTGNRSGYPDPWLYRYVSESWPKTATVEPVVRLSQAAQVIAERDARIAELDDQLAQAAMLIITTQSARLAALRPAVVGEDQMSPLAREMSQSAIQAIAEATTPARHDALIARVREVLCSIQTVSGMMPQDVIMGQRAIVASFLVELDDLKS